MKFERMIGGVVLLACLLGAGCAAAPMSYAQWKKEQAERERYAKAGVPYKSPAQLKNEAAEMRRLTEETVFPAGKK